MLPPNCPLPIPHCPTTLAQSATTKATQADVVVWVGVLVVVAFVGGMLILWIRRRTLASDQAAAGSGSLMDDLRGMLKRGEITQAEFDATRAAMVRRMSEKLKAEAAAAAEKLQARPPQSRPPSA